MGLLASIIPGYAAAVAENALLRDALTAEKIKVAGLEAQVADSRKLVDTLSLRAFGRRMYAENPTPTLDTATAISRSPSTARGRAIEGNALAISKLREIAESEAANVSD